MVRTVEQIRAVITGDTLTLDGITQDEVANLASVIRDQPLTAANLSFYITGGSALQILAPAIAANPGIAHVNLHMGKTALENQVGLAAALEALYASPHEPVLRVRFQARNLSAGTLDTLVEVKKHHPGLGLLQFDVFENPADGFIWLASIAYEMGAAGRDISAEALQQRLRFERANAGNYTPLEAFCIVHDIPAGLTRELVEHIRGMRGRGEFIAVEDVQLATARMQAEKRGVSIPDMTFSAHDAIELVAQAFDRFDTGMGAMVRKAGEDGRIFFDGGARAHVAIIGKSELMPQAARKRLEAGHSGEVYASIPLSPDPGTLDLDAIRLSLNDVVGLAHECGHLAATQRWLNNAKGFVGLPLAETFSALGERLLHNYMMQMYGSDPTWQYAIQEARVGLLQEMVHDRARRDLLMNNIEAAMVANGDQPLTADQLDALTRKIFPDAPEEWRQPAFVLSTHYNLSYPFGAALAEGILRSSMPQADKVEKLATIQAGRQIVDNGGHPTFSQAVRVFGIDIEDALEHVVDEIGEMKREMGKALGKMQDENVPAPPPHHDDGVPTPGFTPRHVTRDDLPVRTRNYGM